MWSEKDFLMQEPKVGDKVAYNRSGAVEVGWITDITRKKRFGWAGQQYPKGTVVFHIRQSNGTKSVVEGGAQCLLVLT